MISIFNNQFRVIREYNIVSIYPCGHDLCEVTLKLKDAKASEILCNKTEISFIAEGDAVALKKDVDKVPELFGEDPIIRGWVSKNNVFHLVEFVGQDVIRPDQIYEVATVNIEPKVNPTDETKDVVC